MWLLIPTESAWLCLAAWGGTTEFGVLDAGVVGVDSTVASVVEEASRIGAPLSAGDVDLTVWTPPLATSRA